MPFVTRRARLTRFGVKVATDLPLVVRPKATWDRPANVAAAALLAWLQIFAPVSMVIAPRQAEWSPPAGSSAASA